MTAATSSSKSSAALPGGIATSACGIPERVDGQADRGARRHDVLLKRHEVPDRRRRRHRREQLDVRPAETWRWQGGLAGRPQPEPVIAEQVGQPGHARYRVQALAVPDSDSLRARRAVAGYPVGTEPHWCPPSDDLGAQLLRPEEVLFSDAQRARWRGQSPRRIGASGAEIEPGRSISRTARQLI